MKHSIVSKLQDQSAIAMPVVIATTLVIGTFVAAGATAAVHAQSQSRHDRNTKRALEAAQSGINMAVYRLNQVLPDPNKCVSVAVNGALSMTDPDPLRPQWCSSQPLGGEDMSDGASYSYDVSTVRQVTVAGSLETRRTIVATGKVSGVVRRLATSVSSEQDVPLFGRFASISLRDTSVANSGRIWEECTRTLPGDPCEANVWAGGQLTLGGSSGTVCGNVFDSDRLVTISNGRLNPSAPTCPVGNAGVPSATTSVPTGAPGAPPTSAAYMPPRRESDTCRINGAFNGQPFPCGGDTTKPRAYFIGPVSAHWDGQALVLQGHTELHLTGGDYSLCYFSARNHAKLVIDKPTQIWMKRPEACPGGSPPFAAVTEQTWGSFVVKDNETDLRNNASDTGIPARPINVGTFNVFMEGSDDPAKPTYFMLDSNLGPQGGDALAATVFAPRSNIRLIQDGDMAGAIVGKDIQVDGNFKLKYDDSAKGLKNPLVFARVKQWTECTAKAAPPVPDEGCDK